MLRRWIVFNAVGALGIMVQLAALAIFNALLDWNYLVSTAAAVETAVLHNFVWHERWTWAERITGGMAGTLRRLARFHMTNGAISIVGNLLLMRLFVGALG
jgi:putative flippase GtrA